MICTGFSHDGKYVVTGDMGGGVRVWGVEERQPVCTFEASDIEVLYTHFTVEVAVKYTVAEVAPTGPCVTGWHQ